MRLCDRTPCALRYEQLGERVMLTTYYLDPAERHGTQRRRSGTKTRRPVFRKQRGPITRKALR